MKVPRFKRWFASLPLLNQAQRRQLLEALHSAAGLDQVVGLIAQIAHEAINLRAEQITLTALFLVFAVRRSLWPSAGGRGCDCHCACGRKYTNFIEQQK